MLSKTCWSIFCWMPRLLNDSLFEFVFCCSSHLFKFTTLICSQPRCTGSVSFLLARNPCNHASCNAWRDFFSWNNTWCNPSLITCEIMRLRYQSTANALVCTRAIDDSVHCSTQTAQMVVTGKVHNRLQRGSCDSAWERERERLGETGVWRL